MSQHEIKALSTGECWAHLSRQRVGRFVFADDAGPAAIPVNYSTTTEEIIFRVSQASHLRDVLEGVTAFEADELHPASGAGWSVLARGQTREIPYEEVIRDLPQMADVPHPLPEGVHNIWLALRPTELTGRELGASI